MTNSSLWDRDVICGRPPNNIYLEILGAAACTVSRSTSWSWPRRRCSTRSARMTTSTSRDSRGLYVCSDSSSKLDCITFEHIFISVYKLSSFMELLSQKLLFVDTQGTWRGWRRVWRRWCRPTRETSDFSSTASTLWYQLYQPFMSTIP